MPLRRFDSGSAPVFITQVTGLRRPIFSDETALNLFLATLHNVKALHPFNMRACVFFPDHFHVLLCPELPTTPSDIMHSLKSYFTRTYHASLDNQTAVWQRRFWDHIIRSQEDLNRHVDYIHYNPVRHGYVAAPELWPHSSYREWQRRGFYEADWGHELPMRLQDFSVREFDSLEVASEE